MPGNGILVFVAFVSCAAVAPFAEESTHCRALSNMTWESPGGVSAGATYCIQKFVELQKAGKNAYQLIDAPLMEGVRHVRVDNITVPWNVKFNLSGETLSSWYSKGQFPYTGKFDAVEWLVPESYTQQQDEARIVFIHGSDARENALGRDYAGFTTRLANWTRLPVLAFNYPTEPIAPWPQNIRNVMYYIKYALEQGPERSGRASKIFLIGDSEGTLVTTQTVLATMDPSIRNLFGYGTSLSDWSSWLGGIILSSPVVDVACETPSFEFNCYNEEMDTGDPDTGNCSSTPTLLDRVRECRWSYLVYHFGFSQLRLHPTSILAEWESHRHFFEQPFINPLRANLSGAPPMLLLAGTRDYFYSDSSRLAKAACESNVDMEVFNVHGVYHDFIEYSNGCGGPTPMNEAMEAYRRIQTFIRSRARSSQHPTILV